MAEESKIWGIKHMPQDAKNAATREAKKAGLMVGEWLALAIREKVKNDRSGSRSLTVKPASQPVSIEQAESVINMLKDAHAIGIETPESLKKQTLSLLRKAVRQVKLGEAQDIPKAPAVQLETHNQKGESNEESH